MPAIQSRRTFLRTGVCSAAAATLGLTAHSQQSASRPVAPAGSRSRSGAEFINQETQTQIERGIDLLARSQTQRWLVSRRSDPRSTGRRLVGRSHGTLRPRAHVLWPPAGPRQVRPQCCPGGRIRRLDGRRPQPWLPDHGRESADRPARQHAQPDIQPRLRHALPLRGLRHDPGGESEYRGARGAGAGRGLHGRGAEPRRRLARTSPWPSSPTSRSRLPR